MVYSGRAVGPFAALCPVFSGLPMPDSNRFGGDWRSWVEEQFVRHAATVRAVIWNRLGRGRDPHQVEELAAETWARAVRGVQATKFDPDQHFAPWVCAIAANVCREYFRRQGRETVTGGLPRPDDLQDPDDFVQAQELLELHRALAECLDALTEPERKVYELRFERGLSGRAAAEALGIPESTFREKLLAGLFEKLARCLDGKGFDEVFAISSAQRSPVAQSSSERKTP